MYTGQDSKDDVTVETCFEPRYNILGTSESESSHVSSLLFELGFVGVGGPPQDAMREAADCTLAIEVDVLYDGLPVRRSFFGPLSVYADFLLTPLGQTMHQPPAEIRRVLRS